MVLNLCEKKLAADLTANCVNVVVEGKEKNGFLFNRDEIDIAATLATKVTGSNNLYASVS